jgi:hypothetical protein
MNKLVDEAPYHPGYEDAVVNPAQKYKGMNPAKMIWNNNELLRQQADRIAELEDKLSFYEIKDLDSGLKPKPLSDEEIKELIANKVTDSELCRAIEERHGIK